MKSIYLLTLLFISSQTFSQGFIIKDFDVKIKIDKDGYAYVAEKINVTFTESKRGIIREIPYKFIVEEKIYKTPISKIKVKDHTIKIADINSTKAIRIGDPKKYLKGDVLYDISYTVKGPFVTTNTYDEFYWNITGNDWTAPIEKARYEIELPDDIEIGYQDLKVFSGIKGSRADSGYIQKEGRIIKGENIATLHPGEGLTISVKLPLHYINPAHAAHLNRTKTEDIMADVKLQWPWAIIPSALISLFIGFWNRTRKRYTPDKIKESMPYPPDDMNPAEVGAFYDHIVNDRDVIALLPYWAGSGFIRMEHETNREDTYIIKLNELTGDRPEYEYTLFRNIFKDSSTVALSSLKEKFYRTHSLVKSMIKREIIDMQLYDEQYHFWFKTYRMWLPVVLMVPLAVISFVLGYWLTGIFFAVGFFIGMIILLQPSVVSQKGHRIQLHLHSFYNFLKGNKSDEIEKVIKEDPFYFDKVFPYAVALKLDKSFITKVKPYIPQAPAWYGYYGIPVMGGSRHSMEDFGREFEPKEITSAFNSMPAPSSSSGGSIGSGGGGFSGGGFGGGGGSSW